MGVKINVGKVMNMKELGKKCFLGNGVLKSTFYVHDHFYCH